MDNFRRDGGLINLTIPHKTYTKINTLYKRDKQKHIIYGDYSLPIFDYLKDNKWRWFEKVNGTNTDLAYDMKREVLEVHGKTDEADNPVGLREKILELAIKENFQNVFKPTTAEDRDNIVRIYGEGYGNDIGDEGRALLKDDYGFIVFDIMINGFFLEWNVVEKICEKLGLKTVAFVGEMTIFEAENLVRSRTLYSTLVPDNKLLAEGLVGRPKFDLYDKLNNRIITKMKVRDYNFMDNDKKGKRAIRNSQESY